ncbi:acyloxyacyl hydrolase [Thalassotalea ponticola]|uniref:acyloxyacyl hydrolase n=1 Tax=Thalassotalea ponticola TaxID=1523392 RepID=UPI0025B30698|nr:acyloxyacyl hydrolase [Thalassotalea ponticola]MDN3651803.1 acyloxyacyl hydrolase [Thalassotalea ponticola]
MEHEVAFSYGQPIEEQNIDIQKLELSYFFPESNAVNSLPVYWYPVVNAGQLQTSAGSGTIAGGGLGLSWYLANQFKIAVEGGMYYYDNFQFGEKGVAYKDYGGPWQFYYRIGPSYRFDKHARAGIAFQHISNGDRYNSNPAFDAYQVYFAYLF